MDEDLFRNLNDGIVHFRLNSAISSKFNSVKSLEVLHEYRQIKKIWFLRLMKNIPVIKIEIDEALYVAEVLTNGIKIEDVISKSPYAEEYLVEITYV